MAEEGENGQEKTEQPTSKRLEQAREQGQVPRSIELSAAADSTFPPNSACSHLRRSCVVE